jgi:hypothetical protein
MRRLWFAEILAVVPILADHDDVPMCLRQGGVALRLSEM